MILIMGGKKTGEQAQEQAVRLSSKGVPANAA